MGKKLKLGKGRLDRFYSLAKQQGLRSRAAFKLEQINKQHDFLKYANVIIDLCAAPGGWMQVASKHAPSRTRIVGVDLVKIPPIRGCVGIEADITTDECRKQLAHAIATETKADVVLHDGAPNVGAAWTKDAYTQNDLVLSACKLAIAFLRDGGIFVTKVFTSADFDKLLYVFRALFDTVDIFKPTASRAASAEIFVVCKGFKGGRKIDARFGDATAVFAELESGRGVTNANGSQGGAEGQDVVGSDGVLRRLRLTDFAADGQLTYRQMEKQKRHRQGYGGRTDLYVERDVLDLFRTVNKDVAFELMVRASAFSLKSKAGEMLLKHPSTTEREKIICSDLKVCGVKDLKVLYKWKTRMQPIVEALFPMEALLETGAEDQQEEHEQKDPEVTISMLQDADLDEDERMALARKVLQNKRVTDKRHDKRLLKRERDIAKRLLHDRDRGADAGSKVFMHGKLSEDFVEDAEWSTDEEERERDREVDPDLDPDEEQVRYDQQMENDLESQYHTKRHKTMSLGEGSAARAQTKGQELTAALAAERGRLSKRATSLLYLRGKGAPNMTDTLEQMVDEEFLQKEKAARAAAAAAERAAADKASGGDALGRQQVRGAEYASDEGNEDDEMDGKGDRTFDTAADLWGGAAGANGGLSVVLPGRSENTQRLLSRREFEGALKSSRQSQRPLEEAKAFMRANQRAGVENSAADDDEMSTKSKSRSKRKAAEDEESESDSGSDYGDATANVAVFGDEVIKSDDLKTKGRRERKKKVKRDKIGGLDSATKTVVFDKLRGKSRKHDDDEDDGGRSGRAAAAEKENGNAPRMNAYEREKHREMVSSALAAAHAAAAGKIPRSVTDKILASSKAFTAPVDIHQEDEFDASDESDTSDESDEEMRPEADAFEAARTLAMGEKLIRRKNLNSVIDASYNRYAWNDPDNMPQWFVDDDVAHNMCPDVPVTKADIDRYRARFDLLTKKTYKKAEEAKARKKRRTMKVDGTLRQRMSDLFENDDLTTAAKNRQLERLYAQHARKKSIIKGGHGGHLRESDIRKKLRKANRVRDRTPKAGGKPVDSRMLNDAHRERNKARDKKRKKRRG